MAQENKAPMFHDMDKDIYGTWLGTTAIGNEPDMVYPQYVPLNSFKKCTYPEPVKTHHIIRTEAVQEGIKGQEPRSVIIYRGIKGGVLDAIIGKFIRENEELRNRIKMLELQVSSERQKSQTAMGGTEEAVQRAVSIAKTARSGSPGDDINMFGTNQNKDYENFG